MHKSHSPTLPKLHNLDGLIPLLLPHVDKEVGVYYNLVKRDSYFDVYFLVVPPNGRMKAQVHDFHKSNEERYTAETYQVIRGEGEVYTGTMRPVDRYHAEWNPPESIIAGDIITISPREPHSIRNTGKDPLVMLLYCPSGNMEETLVTRDGQVSGGNFLKVYNGPIHE